MFSKSCEYALQSVLYIAMYSNIDKAVGLKEIANSQQVPLHFLSKILQQLVQYKVLSSTKGPGGGFRLAQPPEQLKLIRIVEIVDGLDIFERCGIGLKKCSDKNPCPIHFDFKVVKEKIRALLTTKSVSELVEDVKQGIAIVHVKQPG